jgi:hypothetical protein
VKITSPRLPAKELPFCYWIVPGRFLAGEYPGARDRANPLPRLQALLDQGVDFFIDLTEAGEYGLPPYNVLASELASKMGRRVGYRRLSIHDVSVPSIKRMSVILDAIDSALRDEHTVYLHCYAGIGRTGTTLGCYLVRHGMAADRALTQLADWLSFTAKAGRPIPETPEQADFVRAWYRHTLQLKLL